MLVCQGPAGRAAIDALTYWFVGLGPNQVDGSGSRGPSRGATREPTNEIYEVID
jgi:hypothetical protein